MNRTQRILSKTKTRSPASFARTMIGMGEVPDRATLREYLKNGGQNLDPLATAWCAAFVNASLQQAGIKGTGKLNARSFLDWGQRVDTPREGDIAVFSRGNPSGWKGHVGFFQGYNPDGTLRILGGNQSGAVSVKSFAPDRLLGFRRAPDHSSVPGPHSDTHPMAQEPSPPDLQFADPHRFANGQGTDQSDLWKGLGAAMGARSSGRADSFSPSAPIPTPGIPPIKDAVNREAPRTNLAALLAALTEPLEETKQGAQPSRSPVFG